MSGVAHLQGQTGQHAVKSDVQYLCGLAGVARSGFYRQLEAKAPLRADCAIRDLIQKIALAHKYYGYRPMTAELHRQGIDINRKRVLRLMRADNLLSLRRQAFVPRTTDSTHGFHIAPNLMRDLIPTGLNQIWVADITYIRLAEEFIYLAIVLDAFSRRMIGWALDDHLRAELAAAALDPGLRRGRLWRSAPASLSPAA